MKAQFLKEINDALSPNQIQFDHYDVSFKIPRIVSESTRLISNGDYDFLIRESTKSKTVATVKVQITQKKPVGKVGILLILTDSRTHRIRTARVVKEEGEGEQHQH